jgi:hypothetical protein
LGFVWHIGRSDVVNRGYRVWQKLEFFMKRSVRSWDWYVPLKSGEITLFKKSLTAVSYICSVQQKFSRTHVGDTKLWMTRGPYRDRDGTEMPAEITAKSPLLADIDTSLFIHGF